MTALMSTGVLSRHPTARNPTLRELACRLLSPGGGRLHSMINPTMTSDTPNPLKPTRFRN
jgi:hypothetical protein